MAATTLSTKQNKLLFCLTMLRPRLYNKNQSEVLSQLQEKSCIDFQTAVEEYLIRHRSILDVLTKHQEATARVNRAVAKAVTECGCISITAERQRIPVDAEYNNLKSFMSSHLDGELCENCRDILINELGHSLFYLTALCNLTGLDLQTVLQHETRNVRTLGIFNLS